MPPLADGEAGDLSGVLAEWVWPEPQRAWEQLRGRVSPDAYLPKRFELATAAALELPLTAATSLAEDLPLVGVAALVGDRPMWAVGLPLTTPREFVAHLTTGQRPLFEPRRIGELTLLRSRVGASLALGVLGRYLLVGQSSDVLTEFGYHLSVTLPERGARARTLTVEVPTRALQQHFPRLLRERWTKESAKLRLQADVARSAYGRAAEFGDPTAVVAGLDGFVESLLSLLASTQRAGLTLDLDATAAVLNWSLTAVPGGSAEAAWRDAAHGRPLALAALPQGTTLALATFSRAEQRATDAQRWHRLIESVAGDRLARADSTQVEQALSHLAVGRGDDFTLVWLGGQGLGVRASVVDANSIGLGMNALIGLGRAVSVTQSLTTPGQRLSLEVSSVPSAALDRPYQRARLKRHHGTTTESLFELAWHFDAGNLAVVASPQASDWLPELVRSDAARLEVPGLPLGQSVHAALVVVLDKFLVPAHGGGSAQLLCTVRAVDAGQLTGTVRLTPAAFEALRVIAGSVALVPALPPSRTPASRPLLR